MRRERGRRRRPPCATCLRLARSPHCLALAGVADQGPRHGARERRGSATHLVHCRSSCVRRNRQRRQRLSGRGRRSRSSSSATLLHLASRNASRASRSASSRRMRRQAPGESSTALTCWSRLNGSLMKVMAAWSGLAARRSSDASRRHELLHQRRGRPCLGEVGDEEGLPAPGTGPLDDHWPRSWSSDHSKTVAIRHRRCFPTRNPLGPRPLARQV